MPPSAVPDETAYPSSVSGLARAYAAGERDPAADLRLTYQGIRSAGLPPVWIALAPEAEALDLLAEATRRLAAGEPLPLYGVPFAVKDNIDVAGLPTTAACPDFAYQPERSAVAVARLVAAGAIPVGKTNLDQFATGLNGTRSPYGAPACVFDETRVSGGSSSGSAVAVAAGLVPFALGTDTAGSGRVPAAFNNIVGLKPTKGLVSTAGVVPACRSQDCVSVFAGTVADGLAVTRIASGFDAAEPFSRPSPPETWAPRASPFRFGVPGPDWLEPLGAAASALFEASALRLEGIGGLRVPVDFAPFAEAGALLYDGPFVAERLAALRPFAAAHANSLDPSVRAIVEGARRYGAADLFDGQHRLAALAREAERAWAGVDVLLLPTAPLPPTIEAMRADPIGLNAALGRFTTFVNLLDLAALAVPAGFADGLPFGVTLVGRAFTDGALASLGDRLHRADPAATLGGSGLPLAATAMVEPEPAPAEERVLVAVVGAHLAGQPLNGQLTERGGTIVRAAATAPGYSLYALAGTAPPKPGLVRDGGPGGIELEVWSLPVAAFGSFVAAIPPPLGIGTLALADGSAVKGFLCEPHALAGSTDITAYRGWRAYLGARTPAPKAA